MKIPLGLGGSGAPQSSSSASASESEDGARGGRGAAGVGMCAGAGGAAGAGGGGIFLGPPKPVAAGLDTAMNSQNRKSAKPTRLTCPSSGTLTVLLLPLPLGLCLPLTPRQLFAGPGSRRGSRRRSRMTTATRECGHPRGDAQRLVLRRLGRFVFGFARDSTCSPAVPELAWFRQRDRGVGCSYATNLVFRLGLLGRRCWSRCWRCDGCDGCDGCRRWCRRGRRSRLGKTWYTRSRCGCGRCSPRLADCRRRWHKVGTDGCSCIGVL